MHSGDVTSASKTAADRAVSLPGALAIAGGLGLLLFYVKAAFEWPIWNPVTRIAFFVSLIALELWGIEQLLASRKRLTRGGRKRRIMLPPQGFAYLTIMTVMFLGSLLGQSNLLMLMFAMMAGPFVLNGWVMIMVLKRTRVVRRAPPSVMAGETVAVELAIENGKRWLSSWLMEVGDHIVRKDEEISARVLFARVPPRGRRAASYRLKLMRRGRYRLGPLLLTTRFPLGLVERSVAFDEPGELVVYPRLGRLTSQWNRERVRAAELTRRHEPRRGAFDDEFHHLREHRWGDNPRSIHWRSSARQGQLMVREFQESREPDLVLLLDLWTPPRPGNEELDRIELAVSFAATVCVEQLRRGYDAVVELRIAGAEFASWSGRSGPVALNALLSTLALAVAGPAGDVRRLFEESAAVRSRGALTMLVTTRARESAAHAELAEALDDRGRGPSPRVIEVGGEGFETLFRWE
ncbi:MAG: DUF58 domain-containing protein [Planctomycetaceae bacterium]